MPDTPDQEWRRLTAHYAEMWDDELLNIAADYKDLTDIAKQVLRDEMRKRNLADPAAPPPQPSPAVPATVHPAIAEPEPAPPSKPAAKEPPRPVGAGQEREWQRCMQHYSTLGDQDLEELVAEYDYLTPIAQSALRDEMMKRGLGDPEEQAGASREESTYDSGVDDENNPLLAAAEREVQRAASNDWWVRIYETDDREKAEQYAIMLSDAGVQNRWRMDAAGLLFIEVAAEQADHAQQVLIQPIPQSVIDDSKIEVPDFEIPRCPRCHNQEPTLVGTDPTNQWLCESCGNEWSDPIAEP